MKKINDYMFLVMVGLAVVALPVLVYVSCNFPKF